MNQNWVLRTRCAHSYIWRENRPWSDAQSRSRATRASACCKRIGVMSCHGVLGVPVDAGDVERGDINVPCAMPGDLGALVG
eukprot:6377629-Alexandrium_andersonii.AAC.1